MTATSNNDHTLKRHKPKLLQQVRNAIHTRHYSIRTEEAYIGWIRRFILHHNKRHPAEMGEAEINAFLTHLAVRRNVSSSTQNQALCAILFLYKEVLQQDIGTLDNLVWAKRPKKLPVVFTCDEVKMILAQFEGRKWLIANLLYGAGLRHLEALRLRVHDIDFSYGQITVRDAKGAQDRITMLPRVVKTPLQSHLKTVKKHENDLKKGCGTVYLPNALARKYPHANREWGWQYVFPADDFSEDPRSAAGNVMLCRRMLCHVP